jgi:DNA-binding GntR family transcriptional regulator
MPVHILRDKIGIPVKGGIQYIEAVVADNDIASALSASISSPILYFETIMFDNQEKPVEFVQSFYRPDPFRFAIKFNLTRI